MESKPALLHNNKVLVQDMRKRDQLIQKGFGELRGKELVLDLKEALYLQEKEDIEVEHHDGKKASREQLLRLACKEKDFNAKFAVYSDIRSRGFVIKTGYKFGFDFRVYPRGKKPGEEHTQWVIHVTTQEKRFGMSEMSRMVRLAGNLRTTLLHAVVDSENDINYYEIQRVVP